MRLRQALFVAACLGELVTANMSFALISPFFPIYAPTVGLNLGDTSLIFGAMSFAQLLTSPLTGPAITVFGRRRTLFVGAALLTVSGTAFGVVPPLLDQGTAALTGVAAPWLREVLVALRLVQGIGAALTTTCVFAVLADAFPESVGKVMGAAELAAGLGWTLAPPLGGVMYSAGGYSLPFTVFGPMPLCFVLVVLLLYPKDIVQTAREVTDAAAAKRALPPAYQRVWSLGSVGLCLTAAITCMPFSIWSCFDVGFTVWFVDEFEYSVLTATLFFTIAPATYSTCHTHHTSRASTTIAHHNLSNGSLRTLAAFCLSVFSSDCDCCAIDRARACCACLQWLGLFPQVGLLTSTPRTAVADRSQGRRSFSWP